MDGWQLAPLISRKLELLELLHRTAVAQAQLVADDDVSRLMQLLSAKQGLIARLQEIDGELAPSRGDDPAARAWPSPAEHARCQAEAARCETLLAGILELEQVAEHEMIRRRDEVAKRLAEFESASAAQSAYAHAAEILAPAAAGITWESEA